MSMKTSVLSITTGLILVFGCTGDMGQQGVAGPQGEQGPQGDPGVPGELDPNLGTWDKAVAGIGGQAALDGLAGFSIDASGVRKLAGEGYAYDDAAFDADYFDITTHVDLASDSLRVDWSRSILFFGGLPLDYSEIVNADLGVVDGLDSAFGPGTETGDMPSGRWAAVRKQTMLLNPHTLLAMINATPGIASDGGAALHNGAIHELLVVDDPIYPITLYVNASTGRIAKLSTVENDHLHRDIPIEVHFHDWMDDANGGAAFPMSVYLTVNGEIWHEEYRTAITQNPAFTDEFDFPAGSAPMYDADGAAWGMASHQFIQGFNSLGITQNAEQLTVVPTMIDNGVWFLGGSSHNSMAVEQDTGVVIFEAPLYPERSDAILDWVQTTMNKPVTHLVITHHHHDHSGGFRAFVAAGAAIVTGEDSAPLYRELAQAPSTVVPDAQAMNPMEANIVAIPNGGFYDIFSFAPLTAKPDTKAGANRHEKGGFFDISVYHFDSVHSEDMVMGYVWSTGGHIFQSDLFTPGNGGAALVPFWAQQLLDAINFWGLNVPGAVIVGGHGTYGPLTELENYLSGP